jgi:ATP-dependent helicase HrpB
LDLAEVVLMLKAAGVEDLAAFRWLEPPNPHSLTDAQTLLSDLGALDGAGRITELGRTMLAFPLHPRYSRMLLAAEQFGCVRQAALIAALTQGRDLLVRNAGREVESLRDDLFGGKAPSDFWVWLRAWNYAAEHDFRVDVCRKAGIHAQTARQVGPLRDQFLAIAAQEGLRTEAASAPDDAVQKCILTGFPDRVARRLDSGTLRCELVHKRRGNLARESVVQSSPLLVAAEVREVEGQDKALTTILSMATAIEPAWFGELFPADVATDKRVYYDAATRRVYAEESLRFRDLALTTRRIEPPPADEAARLLTAEVLAGRLALKLWDDAVEQWILRLNLLGRWCPELALPAIGESERRELIEQVCHGANSYKDIKEREVLPGVRGWLSAAQLELREKHAPARIDFPNGSPAQVVYVADGSPYVAAKIQQLYGLRATPKIAMNRTPLLIHILAPNMRPVQITKDLAGFWREQYARVKRELQPRYPKHEWR